MALTGAILMKPIRIKDQDKTSIFLRLNAACYSGGVFYSAAKSVKTERQFCTIIGDCGLPYGGFGTFYQGFNV